LLTISDVIFANNNATRSRLPVRSSDFPEHFIYLLHTLPHSHHVSAHHLKKMAFFEAWYGLPPSAGGCTCKQPLVNGGEPSWMNVSALLEKAGCAYTSIEVTSVYFWGYESSISTDLLLIVSWPASINGIAGTAIVSTFVVYFICLFYLFIMLVRLLFILFVYFVCLFCLFILFVYFICLFYFTCFILFIYYFLFI
jgi:hypothetical protein